MKLSICMMVKNEEKYLDMCLSSLQPIRDSIKSELIIVDTGSTDRTVEIAKKYTDNVYFHEWNNNFADMRNKTIKYAKGEWLLILDGDEVIERPEGIIKFLNSKESNKYNTGIFTIINVTDSNRANSVLASIVRLFRNKDFYYSGAIHEQPVFKKPVIEIDTDIIHYGYVSTDNELMEYKYTRNLTLIKKELEKDPDNIYMWFQLSQTYGMHKDKELALDAILKAYKIAHEKNIDLSNKMYIYSQLTNAYFSNCKYKALEKIALEAVKKNDKMVDFYYYAAVAQTELKKPKQAIKNFEKYVELIENQSYYRDASIYNNTINLCEIAYVKLCELYYEEDDIDKALYYIKKVKSDENTKYVASNLVKIYLKRGNYQELVRYYNENILNSEHTKVFYISLESQLRKIEEEQRQNIIEIFSKGESDYSLLNKIRLKIRSNNYDVSDINLDKIKEIEFNSYPVTFADIVYYLIKNKISLNIYLDKVNKNILESHINYIAKNYEDFSELGFDYLNENRNKNDIVSLRINKIIEKVLLVLEKLDAEDFKKLCDYYLSDGITYIKKVYNPEIIDNELIYDVGNNEDSFFIYMLAAKKFKGEDNVNYIKYLRKALKVFPVMKNFIGILTREAEELMKEQKVEKEKAVNSEFEVLKETVKRNIMILLEAKKYLEAEAIINEYLTIVPDDLEMLALKSDIKLNSIQ